MLTLKTLARDFIASWRTLALAMPAPSNAIYSNAAAHLERMLTWEEPQFRQGIMQMYQTLLASQLYPQMPPEAHAVLGDIQQRLSDLIGERKDHFDVTFDWPGNMRVQKAS